MWEESQDRKQTGVIDMNYVLSKKHKVQQWIFIALTYFVAEAVNALTLLYTAMDMTEEPITAIFKIKGAEDRMLTSYAPGRSLSMPYIAKIPEIIEERTYSLNEWKAGIIDLSIDVIKAICLKFNWENPSIYVFREDIEKLLVEDCNSKFRKQSKIPCYDSAPAGTLSTK